MDLEQLLHLVDDVSLIYLTRRWRAVLLVSHEILARAQPNDWFTVCWQTTPSLVRQRARLCVAEQPKLDSCAFRDAQPCSSADAGLEALTDDLR